MDKISTIIAKEWSEVFRNRLVLFSVAFLPLLLVAIPVIMLIVTDGLKAPLDDSINTPSTLPMNCENLDPNQCMQFFLLDTFTLLFMILPISIPVTIAAYSIVGEKAANSLEPLLATPITTSELLIAKMVAAVTPAVLATWLAYSLYVACVWIIGGQLAGRHVTAPVWLVAVFVIGPLLTLLSVSVAIIISSRVTDPRVAEQLSAVVVLPLILFIVAQSAGLIILSGQLILLATLVILAIDALLVFVSVKLFQRETILTRWK